MADKNYDQIRTDYPSGPYKDNDVFVVQQTGATKGTIFKELRDELLLKNVFDIKSISGLNVDLYGGFLRLFNGDAADLSDISLTLDDDETNFVEMQRSTGAVTFNNTEFTLNSRQPLYKVVTASGVITSIVDCRQILDSQMKRSLLPTQTEYDDFVAGDRLKCWLDGGSGGERVTLERCATDLLRITHTGFTTEPRKYPEPLSISWYAHPLRNPTTSPSTYTVQVEGGEFILSGGSQTTISTGFLDLTPDFTNYIAINRSTGAFEVATSAYSDATHYTIYEVVPDSTPINPNFCFAITDKRKVFLKSPVTNFLNLSDTPSSFAASAGKVATVNATNDALEFKDIRQMITARFVDSGGLSTGPYVDVFVDYDCEILSATMLANASGNAVVDIYKSTYANFPTDLTALNSIVDLAKPTLSSSDKSQDVTLTDWTKDVAAGSILRFRLDSASGINDLSVFLTVRKVI